MALDKGTRGVDRARQRREEREQKRRARTQRVPDAADVERRRPEIEFEQRRNEEIKRQYGVGGPKKGVSYQGDATDLVTLGTGIDPDFAWWAVTHPLDRVHGRTPERFTHRDPTTGLRLDAGTVSGPGGFFARRATQKVAREADAALPSLSLGASPAETFYKARQLNKHLREREAQATEKVAREVGAATSSPYGGMNFHGSASDPRLGRARPGDEVGFFTAEDPEHARWYAESEEMGGQGGRVYTVPPPKNPIDIRTREGAERIIEVMEREAARLDDAYLEGRLDRSPRGFQREVERARRELDKGIDVDGAIDNPAVDSALRAAAIEMGNLQGRSISTRYLNEVVRDLGHDALITSERHKASGVPQRVTVYTDLPEGIQEYRPGASAGAAAARDLTPTEIQAKRDRIIGERAKLRFLHGGDPIRPDIEREIARLEDEVATGRGVPDVRASAGGGRIPPSSGPRVASAADEPPPAPAPKAAIPEAEDLVGALPGAKKLRRQQDLLYGEERAKRISQADDLAREIGGREGHEAALRALRGELPKLRFPEGEQVLDEAKLSEMFKHVNEHPDLRKFERVRTRDALIRIMDGKTPQPSEIRLIERAFGPELAGDLKESVGFWRKAYQGGLQVLNVPRALQASIDLSAPFRQGLVLGARHPVMFAREFRPMLKAFKSESAYEDILDDIAQRPTFDAMRKGKLAITDLEGLDTREEQFMSHLAETITGGKRSPVRMSGRAYVGFLNKFRADAFDHYLKTAAAQGVDITDEAFLRSVASWVNHATGRGSIKSLEGAMVPLNSLFFSPRLMASRLQLLNPVYYARLDPFARKQALRGAVQLAGTIGLTLYMAKMAGARVGVDPRSSDFGKIRVGDTRIDIAGGFQQYIVAASRLAKGESVSAASGKVTGLEGGFMKPSRADILARFGQQKSAPVPAFAIGWLKNENFEGDPFDPVAEGRQLFTPIGVQNTYETYQESGAGPAAAGGGLGAIGFGVQTFPDKVAERSGGDRGSRYARRKSSGGSRYARKTRGGGSRYARG